MAVPGLTTTDIVRDSLPKVIAKARIVREFAGVMPTSSDRVRLGRGVGTKWNEIQWKALTAQDVPENVNLDNPQPLDDFLLQAEPTVTGLTTLITDRVAARLSQRAFSRTGGLAQNAIQRKKDTDGLVTADGFTQLGGTGNALTTGIIRAATSRIETGTVVEPTDSPISIVLHPFHFKDIEDEILLPFNPTTNPEQMIVGEIATTTFRTGFKGMLGGGMVKTDGNIPSDGTPDAKSFAFAREGLILVEGRTARAVAERKEGIGGGATQMFFYDEYVYVERTSAGTSVWGFELFGDSTAPTS